MINIEKNSSAFSTEETSCARRWQEQESFKVNKKENTPKKYILCMFPYPSGSLHMGHVRNYVIGDVKARFFRAKGFDVLHPMGWDAFGLPAENAAIMRGEHPKKWTESNISTMKNQLLTLGLSYDWSREIATCSDEYCTAEQELFINLFEAGFITRKKSWINWDPVDNTVLANEQVKDGLGWRSGHPVEKRLANQWFLKTSDFADALLDDLDSLKNWPENVKTMQRKWIGKSAGVEIFFPFVDKKVKSLSVFTTRPETIFGASFCAISPFHKMVEDAISNGEVSISTINKMRMKTLIKKENNTEITGIELKQKKIINPINNQEIPLFIADYVLEDYGNGAIMGCPAHDDRDAAFAEKFSLPFIQVIENEGTDNAYLKNSSEFNGQYLKTAVKGVVDNLEKRNIGKRAIKFKLRDWCISRQRYWGCPIPIIHCQNCGDVPVKRADLPIKLPKNPDFSSSGNPLDKETKWQETKCSICNSPAIRSTETLDTFFESSWYFLAFCAGKPEVNLQSCKRWMPVDSYIGGIEHAILHLLYARLFCKMLTKIGSIDCNEPFNELLTQGMICHKTYKNSNGEWVLPSEADNSCIVGPPEKMSKSRKNVVDPGDMIASRGADAVRLFVMSDNPPEKDMEWSDSGLDGSEKFICKIRSFFNENANKIFLSMSQDISDKKTEMQAHKSIRRISEFIEKNAFNKAIAESRILFNHLKNKLVNEEHLDGSLALAAKAFLRTFEPFAPHVCDAAWRTVFDKSATLAELPWPIFDENKAIDEKRKISIQINGKFRGLIDDSENISKDEAFEKAMKDKRVSKILNGAEPKKIIFVPGKILNLII